MAWSPSQALEAAAHCHPPYRRTSTPGGARRSAEQDYKIRSEFDTTKQASGPARDSRRATPSPTRRARYADIAKATGLTLDPEPQLAQSLPPAWNIPPDEVMQRLKQTHAGIKL